MARAWTCLSISAFASAGVALLASSAIAAPALTADGPFEFLQNSTASRLGVTVEFGAGGGASVPLAAEDDADALGFPRDRPADRGGALTFAVGMASVVPEPPAWIMIGFGFAGLAGLRLGRKGGRLPM